MRRTILVLLAVLVLTPMRASGQEWTAAQEEVIALTQTCWTAWAEEDMDGVARDCPDHPDAVGWFTTEDVPSPGWSEKNGRRWMEAFFPRTQPVYWEIRPLNVRIFGDTALYHFWALWTEEDANGQVSTWTRKQLDVWHRIDGKWYWVGGTSTQSTN